MCSRTDDPTQHDEPAHPCDCGKGEWCPQYGSAFKRARQEADYRFHRDLLLDLGGEG